MVITTATIAQMSVLPKHVPIVVELKPRILSVHRGTDVAIYLPSKEFSFIYANSVANIVT